MLHRKKFLPRTCTSAKRALETNWLQGSISKFPSCHRAQGEQKLPTRFFSCVPRALGGLSFFRAWKKPPPFQATAFAQSDRKLPPIRLPAHAPRANGASVPPLLPAVRDSPPIFAGHPALLPAIARHRSVTSCSPLLKSAHREMLRSFRVNRLPARSRSHWGTHSELVIRHLE